MEQMSEAETERQQLKYAKLSFMMSLISAVFMGAILVIVLAAVAWVMPKAEQIYDSTMVSLTNLETLTTELKEAQLAETVNNINTLTVQATDGINDTMQRIDSLDLETLNQAIRNLNDTVRPMAEFFNVLR